MQCQVGNMTSQQIQSKALWSKCDVRVCRGGRTTVLLQKVFDAGLFSIFSQAATGGAYMTPWHVSKHRAACSNVDSPQRENHDSARMVGLFGMTTCQHDMPGQSNTTEVEGPYRLSHRYSSRVL